MRIDFYFVKVRAQNQGKLHLEIFVTSLLRCGVYHLNQLWRGFVFNLKNHQANAVSNHVTFWTRVPRYLNYFWLLEVFHLDRIFNLEYNIWLAFKFNFYFGVELVQKISKYLYVMLIGHMENLVHRNTLKWGVHSNISRTHDQLVEILLNQDSINFNIRVITVGHLDIRFGNLLWDFLYR